MCRWPAALQEMQSAEMLLQKDNALMACCGELEFDCTEDYYKEDGDIGWEGKSVGLSIDRMQRSWALPSSAARSGLLVVEFGERMQ